MAVDAGQTLQEKVYDALRLDAAIIAYSATVHDEVPADVVFPYIQLESVLVSDNGTKTDDGEEHRIELHIWSDYRGWKELNEINRLIDDVLHDQSLTLADHRLVNMRRTTFDKMRDVDPRVRHGIKRLRAVTEEI